MRTDLVSYSGYTSDILKSWRCCFEQQWLPNIDINSYSLCQNIRCHHSAGNIRCTHAVKFSSCFAQRMTNILHSLESCQCREDTFAACRVSPGFPDTSYNPNPSGWTESSYDRWMAIELRRPISDQGESHLDQRKKSSPKSGSTSPRRNVNTS